MILVLELDLDNYQRTIQIYWPGATVPRAVLPDSNAAQNTE